MKPASDERPRSKWLHLSIFVKRHEKEKVQWAQDTVVNQILPVPVELSALTEPAIFKQPFDINVGFGILSQLNKSRRRVVSGINSLVP